MKLTELFPAEKIRVGNVAAGQASKKGPRSTVYESHHGNLNRVMSGLREMGHGILNVEHTDGKKMPVGMSRSTVRHKSGSNKFKTVVRTAFNMEDGGDHHVKVITHPDTDDQKKAKEEEEIDAGGPGSGRRPGGR